MLNRTLAAPGGSLPRDPRSGYLPALLDALGISPESQLLVTSRSASAA